MTMHHIATVTTTSGGFADFNNIPQNFTNLQIRVSGASTYTSGGTTGPLDTWIGLNNQSGTVFTNGYNHRLQGDGSSASATGFSQGNLLNTGFVPFGFGSTFVGSYIIDILDYTDTNKNKVIRSMGGYDANGSGIATLYSGLAILTATVEQIRIAQNAGGFTSGSKISLYGITINPTATGV
jgi:hypothetical protein